MSIENILSQIDAELDKLKKARVLLASAGRVDLKKVTAGKVGTKPATKPARKRVLSAEARKRIADAQRKRWAAQKKNK